VFDKRRSWKLVSEVEFHLGSRRPATRLEKRVILSLMWGVGSALFGESSRMPKQWSCIAD